MTMSDNVTNVRVAPAADGPELTEHVNVLMTEDMRAFLLGCKIVDRARSEGAVARVLLADAIGQFRRLDERQYELRVARGREELARRAAQRA